MVDYYNRSSSQIGYFGSTGAGQTEPNMRQEMINTLQGSFPEIAKGKWLALRRMSRDADGKTIACGCIDRITGEPDKDIFCPFCFGTGMFFDEEYISGYRQLLDTTFSSRRRHDKTAIGDMDVPFVAFFFAYDGYITREDRVVEVVLNDDGSVQVPVKYIAVYRIDKAWDYRGDNGKLEFWKVFTHKEELKYLTTPDY
jgi:hypothetical protein